MEAEAQANCFVNAFGTKHIMIDEELNEYSERACAHPIFYCGQPLVGATDKILASSDEDSALGPDLVPTRILKAAQRYGFKSCIC